MKVYNKLPLLLDCLKKWETLPNEQDFHVEFLAPMHSLLEPMLEDFKSFRGFNFYEYLKTVEWKLYRDHALKLDVDSEELRLKKNLRSVEKLLDLTLHGEVVIFGSFQMMDGFARFHQGNNRVFLGVDESFHLDSYLDVLTTHELTHVAREGSASVWEGFGLNPKMTHDEFVASMPTIEHIVSEGFSCVVSEILNPHEKPWNFVYQTAESLQEVATTSEALDRRIHAELQNPNGHYRNLYQMDADQASFPRFSHYVWAWKFVHHLMQKYAQNDARKFMGMCSKDFVGDALEFKLKL